MLNLLNQKIIDKSNIKIISSQNSEKYKSFSYIRKRNWSNQNWHIKYDF